MRGKPKVNQPVIVKHETNPIIMHIDSITPDGLKCTCVWHDKIGAPYRSEFNTDILESYKANSSKEEKVQVEEGGNVSVVNF
jgi:uncharacterized protein YodC (DUF2158 family)